MAVLEDGFARPGVRTSVSAGRQELAGNAHQVLKHPLHHLVVRHVTRCAENRVGTNRMQTLDILEPSQRSVGGCNTRVHTPLAAALGP